MRPDRLGCVAGAIAGMSAGFAAGVYFLLAGPPEGMDALYRPPVWSILLMPMLLFGLLGVFAGILIRTALRK